tara:strand:- start:14 stop:1225 length:1212 start_codon:yes stop_codon:yes gene_type:complete
LAKRILIYTNHFSPEQFKINEIVDWITTMDYEVRVVTGIPNYPLGKYYKGYGLHSISKFEYNGKLIVNRLPLIPRGNGGYIMLMLNYFSYFLSTLFFTVYLLFKKKYDFIFVHHTSPFLIAIHPIIYSVFSRKTKKYLWDLDIWPETLEAMNIIRSRVFLTFISKFVQFIYSFYDKILIGSNGFRDIIEKRFNKEIIYFPNWAEKEIEDNIITELNEIIFPENKFIIMYTGNIGAAQNFNSLVTTIKELEKEDILWVFIGGGRFKNEFRSSLKYNNLLDKCLFKDPVRVSEIPAFSSYADAMFLSLKPNAVFARTVPAKLQSYLAIKKPVIAVLEGEGADIIKRSNCGIVQEKADYIKLSNQIRKMIKLPEEEMIRMGNNGRAYYDENFSQSIRKHQLLKLFS